MHTMHPSTPPRHFALLPLQGQEMGMFHFGGSSSVLVFGPSVIPYWNFGSQSPSIFAANLNVRSMLCTPDN